MNLAPLYSVDGAHGPEEQILENWPGYCGDGPVRIGNGASLHTQNDVFGEMVMSLVPIFLDDRYRSDRSRKR